MGKKPKFAMSPNSKNDMFQLVCQTTVGIMPTKEFMFHNQRKWRFDYAFPELKIAIEVEGGVWTQGRHVRPKGYIGDMEKYNQATLYGWSLLRFTPDEVLKTKTLNLIKELVILKMKGNG